MKDVIWIFQNYQRIWQQTKMIIYNYSYLIQREEKKKPIKIKLSAWYNYTMLDNTIVVKMPIFILNWFKYIFNPFK
jgi:hypothetical protein